MNITQKKDPKKEQEIDAIKDDYLELEQTVSELRRKGKPTQIAEVMLLEVPAKIKMARTTEEDRDIFRVKKAMEDIRKEVDEINQGSEFDHINTLIREAFENLRKDEKGKAVKEYAEIMELYKLLGKDLQNTVYSACIELRKRLSENGRK
ncbi:hypothetical protein GF323_04210 [Candidatus Woesearchaeota archaeon]|nr:hypothetical protein [Candidatus Woesearchaeota archaeon]